MTEFIPEKPPETVLSQNPENVNFLNPENFKFILKRAPNVNFFLQKITFPRINVPPVKQPTPFVDIWRPGVDVEHSTLNITFKVDENFVNWCEIYYWLVALGEEESLHPYRHLELEPVWSGEGVVSDIVVHILDSAKLPNYTFYFHDCFPITLGEMPFDVTPREIAHQTCSAEFRFTNFKFEKAG